MCLRMYYECMRWRRSEGIMGDCGVYGLRAPSGNNNGSLLAFTFEPDMEYRMY